MSVGGKGQQFSRAASHLIPGMVTLAQFLGGENGERLGRLIEHAGVNQITVASAGETRCCNTVIDAAVGDATELIEPSAPILPGEVEQLLSRTLQTLARGEISGLALCGTYPPGVDEQFYVTLALAKGKALLLLDSYQEIAATLATGQVDILKDKRPRVAESRRQEPRPPSAGHGRGSGVDPRDGAFRFRRAPTALAGCNGGSPYGVVVREPGRRLCAMPTLHLAVLRVPPARGRGSREPDRRRGYGRGDLSRPTLRRGAGAYGLRLRTGSRERLLPTVVRCRLHDGRPARNSGQDPGLALHALVDRREEIEEWYFFAERLGGLGKSLLRVRAPRTM